MTQLPRSASCRVGRWTVTRRCPASVWGECGWGSLANSYQLVSDMRRVGWRGVRQVETFALVAVAPRCTVVLGECVGGWVGEAQIGQSHMRVHCIGVVLSLGVCPVRQGHLDTGYGHQALRLDLQQHTTACKNRTYRLRQQVALHRHGMLLGRAYVAVWGLSGTWVGRA
jgi:hypothetical protein